MFFAYEQDVTERYIFFSEGSNGAGKTKFVSQYTCLQPHLKDENKRLKYIINNYCVSHTHISNRKR